MTHDRSVSNDEFALGIRDLGFSSFHEYRPEAFSRNLGLINPAEQLELAHSTVAIPGLGGVGGLHLIALVRSGVGRFHISDFDTFDPANVNRQYGAKTSSFGEPKLQTMADEALDINPFLELRQFPEGVNEATIDEFLDGVDVVVDSLDFFEFPTRRMLFQRARQKGLHVVTAGPIGFSTALLVFSPDRGMTFDEYFNVNDETDEYDRLAAFLVGLTPRTRYLSYMDINRADRGTGRAPSLGLACHLCAGAATTEVLRILLKRNPPEPAPNYAQFDAYLRRYFRGRLWFGNRHPMQRLKRRWVRKMLEASATESAKAAEEAVVAPQLTEPDQDRTEVARYLIKAGIQAPSGDNAQPWKFSIAGDTVHVYNDADCDRSFFNFRQYASLISCGAVIENMVVAARGCGVDPEISMFPTEGDDEHVASIRLAVGQERRDPLQNGIWDRHTNRTMFRRAPLLPSVVDELDRSIEVFEGARLHVVSSKEQLRLLARVVQRADRLRVAIRSLHEHFHSMVRYTEREALASRDGFPLPNLEAGFVGDQFLKLTKPWPVMSFLNKLGFDRLFSAIAARGLQHCSAAALLTVPRVDSSDLVMGGRALERAWLTLTTLGFAVQPMTALTIFWLRSHVEGNVSYTPSQRRLLDGLWGEYSEVFPEVDFDNDAQVMLFRFGFGGPVSIRTYRKPLDDFLTDEVRSNGGPA
jgi:molybdopterin/thiamine biosynthesis adenylyltransferase